MGHPIPGWLRAIFVLVALQALLLLLALVDPVQVNVVVPWPAPPLHARFIASLYTALGLGVLWCSRAATYRQVRIVLIGIGIATALLFVLTIPYLGELKQFPTFWLLFYLIDPLLVVYSLWRFRGVDPAPTQANPLTPLWLSQAVIWGILGLVLLVLPGLAPGFWPWKLPSERLTQLYSAFFVTLSIASVLAMREPRWDAVQVLAGILTLLPVLVIAVSLYHLPTFNAGIPTVVWFVFFAAEALVFGGLLLRHLAQPAVKGVAA